MKIKLPSAAEANRILSNPAMNNTLAYVGMRVEIAKAFAKKHFGGDDIDLKSLFETVWFLEDYVDELEEKLMGDDAPSEAPAEDAAPGPNDMLFGIPVCNDPNCEEHLNMAPEVRQAEIRAYLLNFLERAKGSLPPELFDRIHRLVSHPETKFRPNPAGVHVVAPADYRATPKQDMN